MDLTEARRRIAELIRFFEERYGVSVAFESGVSGELLQAYTALRRAETAAEKLGEPHVRTGYRRSMPERGGGLCARTSAAAPCAVCGESGSLHFPTSRAGAGFCGRCCHLCRARPEMSAAVAGTAQGGMTPVESCGESVMPANRAETGRHCVARVLVDE